MAANGAAGEGAGRLNEDPRRFNQPELGANAEPEVDVVASRGMTPSDESELRLFRAHFERLPGPAYMVQRRGQDYQLVAYNRAAAALPFSRAEKMLGALISDFLGDHPTYIPDLRYCDESSTVVTREVDFLYGTTGSQRRVVLTFIPVFPGTVVVHTEDVTERRAAEQALRDAEARNRALLDANPDIIFRIDSGGRYLDVSVSPQTKFPYAPEDLVGRQMSDFFSEEFAREHLEHVHKAIDTGEMQIWESRLKVGRSNVEFEARYVRSGPAEAVVMVRDITERLALEREVISVGERERRRIARDLHDGLGQHLTGLSLALQDLSRRLADDGSPYAASVRGITVMSQDAIAETRRIAGSLAPSFSSETGLAAALTGLGKNVADYAGVNCRVHCEHGDDVHDVEFATHLYRIAQEAVNNALKHADASDIDIYYGRDGGSFYLKVVDNGIGIPDASERVAGLGLKSMNYRARMIGARLEVSRGAKGGTQVLCAASYEYR